MNTMEGPLFKWTNMMKGYQPRWFVLDDVNGLLSYYTVRALSANSSPSNVDSLSVPSLWQSQEKLVKGDRRGCIRLKVKFD